ncbi:MAG: peptidoglycan bridge formation glycyltransferase FemA/FemB family protein [Clostridia bacterium]|nr:peptidoglycan bridge formation glycyltransferase FemA/FemB family protein [Clostridia bacterium]
MKTEIIGINNAAEFDEFTANHKSGHFMQTSLWGKVKDDWGWFGVICRDGSGNITGTLAVLLRKISALPYHMMYAPRGPVCDLHDKETFNALIDAAKKEGEKYKAYELKIDKDAPASDEEYKKIAFDAGFAPVPHADGLDGFQCCLVNRINIDGRSEDEVFASFHSKHRYNVRVAKKHNVEIKICGSEKKDEFYTIMKETCERDKFAVRPAAYFGKILDTFGDKARLYMAYYEGEPVAGALSVLWGNKVWYFYGASLSSHRNVMPNHLLQWEMIRWAIESGCDIYDFRGLKALDDSDGLYRFKKGFGGDFIEFAGEMNLIIKPAAAKLVSASQEIIKKIK